MVYIIVLNWNGIEDTLCCLDSLLKIKNEKFKIVICDNGSSDGSSSKVNQWYHSVNKKREELSFFYKKIDRDSLTNDVCGSTKQGVYFIDIGENLGYAGGNNIGIEFSLMQDDMDYVWLLNNDTIVQENSLACLKETICSDPLIGVCGSKLVYYHDNSKLQGLGGKFYPLLCISKHYKANANIDTIFDEKYVSSKIDYVIGASMFITRNALNQIGLLCEDYFLYFEEIDYCLRAKKKGFKIATSVNSIVYHKEGGSTQKLSRGAIADFYAIRNRLLVSKKFYPIYYPIVYLSLFLALYNRISRREFDKVSNVIKVISFRKLIK